MSRATDAIRARLAAGWDPTDLDGEEVYFLLRVAEAAEALLTALDEARPHGALAAHDALRAALDGEVAG